jgi:hypothetical protein
MFKTRLFFGETVMSISTFIRNVSSVWFSTRLGSETAYPITTTDQSIGLTTRIQHVESSNQLKIEIFFKPR